MRKFTCIGGGSRKFWEVEEPEQVDKSLWAVKVRFGRIGQWGQERVHFESSKWAANSYYMEKVGEKERKGYKETGKAEVKNNVVTYTPDYLDNSPKPQACSHDSLARSGKTWKCNACKKTIDFGRDAAPVESMGIEVVTQVRRFFDLGAR